MIHITWSFHMYYSVRGRGFSRFTKAFTLIELLVVIAIIALLAAILFPVFATARENARKATCQSNLKQIGLGIVQYAQDFDETQVPAYNVGGNGTISFETWMYLLQPYVRSYQVYSCPDSQDPVLQGTGTNTWGQYVINNSYVQAATNSAYKNHFLSPTSTSCITPDVNCGSGYPLNYNAIISSITSPSTTVLMFDGENIHGTGYSHVAALDAEPDNASTPTSWSIQPNLSADCSPWGGGSGCPVYSFAGDPELYTTGLGGAGVVARHNGFSNVLWCDGHVKAVTLGSLYGTAATITYSGTSTRTILTAFNAAQ